MKRFLMLAFLTSGFSFAAEIRSAKYDILNDKLILELTYGGCHLDRFALSFGPCKESFPMQATATLDDSMDTCRAIARAKKVFSLTGLGRCRPVYLTVTNSTGMSKMPIYIPEPDEH